MKTKFKIRIKHFFDRFGGHFLVALIFIIVASPPLIKQHKVQKRFGFSVATPELGGRFYNKFEPLVIMRVDKDEAFYNAGLRFGDVLLDSTYNWVHKILGSYNQPTGTKIYIQTIPDGVRAKNWEELSKMERITREVIAP